MLRRHLRDHGRGPRRARSRSRTRRCSRATPSSSTPAGASSAARTTRATCKSCPGIGVKAAQWLIAKDPMLLGADNWPVEVAPNPDPQLSLPVHQLALVVNGVHLLENLKLDELAAEAGLRVRLHDAAAEDPGRHRLDRRPGRRRGRTSPRAPLPVRAGRVRGTRSTAARHTRDRQMARLNIGFVLFPDLTPARLHRSAAGAAPPARLQRRTSSPRRAIPCPATAA